MKVMKIVIIEFVPAVFAMVVILCAFLGAEEAIKTLKAFFAL